MTKLVKYIFIFLISSSPLTYSQNSNETSANIRVKILKGLTIEPVKGNLNFGEIFLNENFKNIVRKPSEGIEFRVIGNPNKSVIISFNEREILISEKEANFITFNSDVVHTGNSFEYINPNPVRNGESYQLRKLKREGYLYLWVGGNLQISSNQSSGSYKGVFNITVAY